MNAQQLKNAILQEAIEGRLVPQDPNDEPASVLLARIRKEKEQLVKEGKLKKKDLEVKPISEDEIPFEIPESWEWVRMSSLIQLLSGQDFPPEKYNSNNKGVPYITGASNIENGKLVINRWTEFPSVIGRVGDLLIVCKGSGVGKMCISDIPIYHIARQIQIIRCFSSLVLLDYLKVNIDANLSNIVANAQGVIPGISRDHILDLLLPIPPLAEQHRIVAKIEELLPKVEEYGKAQDALNKLNAELPERLKKSILQEAIEGRLVPQDPNDEPASVLLDKIRQEKAQLVKAGKLKKKDLIETPVEEDEAPFSIPNSWKWVRFGDLVSTSTGKTPARGDIRYWGNKDYSWVSISDMKQGEKIINTKEYVSTKAANDCFHNEISKRGTLIMSFKLTVGRTSILGIDAYHNEAIISIKTYADKENYIRDYLSYILPVVTSWGDSKDAIKGKTLNAKSIYNLLIPLPPLVEQHRIVKKIEQLLVEINKLKM